MKKILLLFILSVTLITVKSQSLAGTIWFGTNPPSLNLYFQFTTDTLYYSSGTGYLPLSLYTAVSGQFTINDLTGTALCRDTGFYTYSIVGNHLTFTVITDSCVSRRNTLVNYNWTLISSTGIPLVSHSSPAIVFPNPSADGNFTVSIPAFVPGMNEIVLCDLMGRVVYRGKPETSMLHIDISFLPRGIYLGYCFSENGNSQFLVER